MQDWVFRLREEVRNHRAQLIFGKISQLFIERIHYEMGQKFNKTCIGHCIRPP